MEAGMRSYGEELVAVLSAAADGLSELAAGACRLTGADLDVVLPVVDRLAALAQACRFTIAGEAEARGEIDGSTAGTVRQWLAERCPSLDERETAVIAKAVRELSHRTSSAPATPSRPAGCRCRPASWWPVNCGS